VSRRVAITWDEALVAYDFGPQHPLKPIRVKLTVELARAYGLLDLSNVDVVKPRSATRDELELVHTPAYIDAVERISKAATDPYGNYGWGIGIGDNPAFRGMHEASALVAGASLVAAEQVASGAVEHAFNPAGGLHHAMPDRASGFCIYDDPAIAIRWLTGRGERVVYIDVDVHHGDGPQFIFYDDPDVMTISLHESGEYLFPGTGFVTERGAAAAEGTKVNVPLAPGTGDRAWLAAFDAIVPPILRAFRPAVLVSQLGCDTHAGDPLAHFRLTTRAYRETAVRLHALAHEAAGGRWLATGGGGYRWADVVPRAWTLYFAEMCDAVLHDALPESWIEKVELEVRRAVPATFGEPAIEGDRITAETEAIVEQVWRTSFPHFGIRA
jgi:acetoin utilization protein AcuC